MTVGLGVLLIGPDTGFYKTMLAGFAKGFASFGCRAVCLAGFTTQETVAAWAKRHDVGLIFDLNAMIDAADPWPSGIRYVRWFHDPAPAKELRAPLRGYVDHTYFLMNPRRFGLLGIDEASWSIFPPGGDVSERPDRPTGYQCDVCFAGYIARPVRNVHMAVGEDGRQITLNEFYKFYPSRLTLQSSYDEDEIEAGIRAVCERLKCEIIPAAKRLLHVQMIRQRERSEIIKSAARCTKSIQIYGDDNWLKFDEFTGFFKGYVDDPVELLGHYRAARINLHNGPVSFHHRVLECMLAGAFMLVTRSTDDEAPRGIRDHFEPGVHYDDFTLDTAEETIARYLKDGDRREKMIDAAWQLANQNHTWINRAEEVLTDLSLEGATPRFGWDPNYLGDPGLKANLGDVAMSPERV